MRATAILTERLALDPLRVADAGEMFEVLGDQRLHEHIGGSPLSPDELQQRYERLAIGRSADGDEIWLNWIVRLRVGGIAVGTVQATISESDRAHAQIAWVTGVAWQRRGIASEATIALVSWLDAQGITTISASVHPRHVASRRVARRAGLRPTGETESGEQVWRR